MPLKVDMAAKITYYPTIASSGEWVVQEQYAIDCVPKEVMGEAVEVLWRGTSAHGVVAYR